MNVKRILIIRFSSLGDIILLTVLFREVKKCFGNASIDFLTTTTFSSVCANNPHLDKVITFDRIEERSELLRVARLIKEKQYDLVLDAHHSLRSRMLLTLAFGPIYRIKKTIQSIDKRSWKRNLLLQLKVNLLHNAVSQREAYCQLLTRFTRGQLFDFSTELYPSSDDKVHVSGILHQYGLEGKRIVALGPGASFPGKCWPKESYLELSNKLLQCGYSVVLVGGKTDKEPQWIVTHSATPPINLSGDLSYLETAAFLQACELSISNDSAIVHFSEAVGTPSIAIFGPTVKEFGYGPYMSQSRLIEIPLPCRPCSRNGKGNCRISIKRQCLIDIPVNKVFQVASNILGHLKSDH